MSNPQKILTPRVVVRVFLAVVVPCLPLLISGRWGWWEVWVFALLSVALAARRHPDLLAERTRMARHADAEPWDKLLSSLVSAGRRAGGPHPPGAAGALSLAARGVVREEATRHGL